MKNILNMLLNNKLTILLLILSCFTLMSCPPGNYTEYSLVKKDLNKSRFGYHYILNENIEFNVKARTYYSFVKSVKSGISTSFQFEEKDQMQMFKNLNIKVHSKSFGELKPVDVENHDQLPKDRSDNLVIFGAKLEKKEFRGRRIESDTIFITLNEKKILEFSGMR